MLPSTRESRRARLLQLLAEHDVRCPSCAYTLRGLDGVQCPECGWVFDEVLLRDQLAPPLRWPLPGAVRWITILATPFLTIAQVIAPRFSKTTGADLFLLVHGTVAMCLAIYWFGTARRAARYTAAGSLLRLSAVWAILVAATIIGRLLR